AARGLVEAVAFSFVSARAAALFGGGAAALRLVNPISAELDTMRPSLLPALVEAARRNADRGLSEIALFELGPLYRDDTPAGQVTAAGGVRAGAGGPRDWRGKPPPWYHPGRAGVLRLGPAVLGHFGELHPEVLDAFDARGPIAAFEVFLDAVPAPRAGRARPPLQLSVFQPVERDFAFVVDAALPAETLLRAARG